MTSAEEFNCILCKEKFDNKDELQIHFRKHGDPKFNESIKIKRSNQNETPLANEKSNDASEMVNCDVCDEVFPTISKAITHKHKVHPEHDAKYFCPWCGKLFTMKHLYNKHLYTNHDVAEETPENNDSHFHCDSCSVYFFIPAAMVYHNKFFHRQETDAIIGHSKKQKLFDQDLLPVYYCSFCGEEYINKVNLHVGIEYEDKRCYFYKLLLSVICPDVCRTVMKACKKHICEDHSDENQRPTDVLRCPLCEAIFYHLDAYELHLSFHSLEDLYIETNEMNDKELTEFSLETVPPLMERIEDLNSLPDVESGVNNVGIESFLQMAMDEPTDTGQLHEKKSKKHKKHKKSKKPAITLDEFLSMNQDVFGEDFDFQGIEEVPTKVLKKQLKVKKTQFPKKSAKFVSSADLQKLQKQGIVVKVQSSKPPLSQLKPVIQPVKINQQVKNLSSQTKTKAISASNEVLSKLLNQSSNQLKIVKKPVQEKAPNIESEKEELKKTENLEDKTQAETTKTALDSMERISDEKEEHPNTQNGTLLCSPQNRSINDEDNTDFNAEDHSMSVPDECDESGNKQQVNANYIEGSNAHKQLIKSNQIQATHINQNKSPENGMNDTLKNIGKQITIKPITQPVSKSHAEEEPARPSVPELKECDSEDDQIPTNVEEHGEQDEINEKNKSLNSLKNLNSAITIKPLKKNCVPVPYKNTSNENSENMFKQVTLNNAGSSSVQRIKLENVSETVISKCDSPKEKSVQMTPSSQVLKNISKNITIKSLSPTVRQSNEIIKSDENNDSDFDNYDEFHDDINAVKNIKSFITSSFSDTQKTTSQGQKLNSDRSIKSTQSPCPQRVVVNIQEKMSDDGTSAKSEVMNTSNNLLKHLKNITAKPVSASRNTQQEATAKTYNKATPVTTENNVTKKSMTTKEISKDIEIFNIDDSDDEVEQAKPNKSVTTPIKIEPTQSEPNSHAALNVIKNISKNITIRSSNNQSILKNVIKMVENNAEPFSNEEEINNDAEYSSNDDCEDHAKSYNIKSLPNKKVPNNKEDPFKNVLKHLGKHITVKSRNASPNPSIKSLDYASQDLNQVTTGNDTDSDEDFYSEKVKITEMTSEDDEDIEHSNNCDNDNAGVVVQSPEDSNSGDEQLGEIEKKDECQNQNMNMRLNKNFKTTSEGLLKNISKNITIKSLNERADNEVKTCKTAVPENELIANQAKLCKELLIKPIKQNKPEILNDNEKAKTSDVKYNKQIEGKSPGASINPRIGKTGIVNTVNKEVKVKTFQSETVIEEITTTVTKTIRRVNQTINQQVFNSNQISPSPRMIKPNTGPRMANIQSNNLQGVTVRQATPGQVRPKIRPAIPYRPVPGTVVRPSNQLVPIRPNVTQIRPNNSPRMPVRNMPRQQRPVGRPIKISPNVVNQKLKRPGNNDESQGHFSCFKKPKESLIPGNETAVDTGSDLQYASSSQISKFSSTTQIVKGNSVTTTQMKSESLSQKQQINRLGNVSGLRVAKTSQVSQVEKTEINASKRTALEAIEKLQKQGLLVKKPRVEEDSDLPNSDGEANEQFNDEDYDE